VRCMNYSLARCRMHSKIEEAFCCVNSSSGVVVSRVSRRLFLLPSFGRAESKIQI
jgi:hypothetical protein